MQTHTLKATPEYFSALWEGEKTAEVRKNDRNFRVGDHIVVKEFKDGQYTGFEIGSEITHVLDNFEGLAPGYVCLSIDVNFQSRRRP